MKIAFFTDMFLPQINGVTTAVISMAKNLADRGHHIYIIAPRFPQFNEFMYPNITVKRCVSIPAFVYPNLKLTTIFDPAIARFIRNEGVDIIHAHTPATLGLQAVLLAKLLRLPLIGTFHGFFMDCEYLKHARVSYGFVQQLLWRYSNFFYKQCNMITCPSEGTKKELLKNKCKGSIKVIPYGIDTGIFDNSKASRVKATLNAKGKLLLHVGRIAHEKNIPYLLECFALVLKKVPSAKLVVVGDGPQMPEVKAKIRKLKISGNVILTGAIPHEKLVKSGIFGACDVFVTASKTETGPLVVLEAQANGLVCVGVKGKGMTLIKNGVNGYEVEPENIDGFARAVIKLLKDDSIYKRMKNATLRNVVKYDINHVVAELEKIYGRFQKGGRRTESSVIIQKS